MKNRGSSRRRKSTSAPREQQRAEPQRVEVSEATRAWLDRCVLLGMLVFTFLVCCYPVRDCDIWWHIRTGQLIWERGEVPRTDWFSYTNVDRPWIDLHWCFQLCAAALYSLGGISLLTLIKAFFLTLAVAVGWQAAGQLLPAWIKAALWLPAIINISARTDVRPEFVSLLCLAAWLWIVMRLEKTPWLIWLLPAITVVWVNFQSLFILGPVVGACYAIDRIVRSIARGRWGLEPPPERPTSRVLLWAGLLTAVACLVNPYFAHGAGFPLILYQKFNVAQETYATIGEFIQPKTFILSGEWRRLTALISEIVLWLITAASFVWLGCLRRWSVLRLALFLAFSHLAWEAARNTNIFSLVAAVVLCANVGDALRVMRGTELPVRLFDARAAYVGAALAVASLIVSVFTGHWDRFIGESKPLALGEAQVWFAHDAAQFAGKPGMPDRAYISHFGQAAVYEFHNGPERKVFMDPRLEVMTPETLAEWQFVGELLAAGNPAISDALRDDAGGLPVIILDSRESRPQIEGLLHTPGWRMVFADQAAAVFVDEASADRLKLPVADPEPLKRPPGLKPARRRAP